MNTQPSPKDLLVHALVRLTVHPESWIKGGLAIGYDEKGKFFTALTDPKASCFCALGQIAKSYLELVPPVGRPTLDNMTILAVTPIHKAAIQLGTELMERHDYEEDESDLTMVANFNDARDTTLEDVRQLFIDTINRPEKKDRATDLHQPE